MTLQRIEIGLVSADDILVEFYASVFELERLPVSESGSGVVHRLQAPGAVLKVMVPAQQPTSAGPVEPFFAAPGLRYLTLYVSDFDRTIERATARGGHVDHGPMRIGPDMQLAILRDPDGNTIEVVDGPP